MKFYATGAGGFKKSLAAANPQQALAAAQRLASQTGRRLEVFAVAPPPPAARNAARRPKPRAKNPGFDQIRSGSRVTIVNRFGQKSTGTAVLRGPAGWVLNMGGRYGTPAIADEKNTVAVRASRKNPDYKSYPADTLRAMLNAPAQHVGDAQKKAIRRELERRAKNPARKKNWSRRAERALTRGYKAKKPKPARKPKRGPKKNGRKKNARPAPKQGRKPKRKATRK